MRKDEARSSLEAPQHPVIWLDHRFYASWFHITSYSTIIVYRRRAFSCISIYLPPQELLSSRPFSEVDAIGVLHQPHRQQDYLATWADAMRQAPTVGATRWKRRPRRDGRSSGPNYTKGRIITEWKQQICIPVTVSGIYSHSKTGKLNVNAQLLSSRGTAIEGLTLQVDNNPQHDTSLCTSNSKPPWLRIMGSIYSIGFASTLTSSIAPCPSFALGNILSGVVNCPIAPMLRICPRHPHKLAQDYRRASASRNVGQISPHTAGHPDDEWDVHGGLDVECWIW